MELLSRERLLSHSGGRHFASEPHLRIQVLPVGLFAPSSTRAGAFFDAYHGELLIICLVGGCSVTTKAGSVNLAQGDQALLVDGEAFRLDSSTPEATVQLIWAPGPNPCRSCWERDAGFFAPSSP